jgi:2-desacetyl-2-hydroxyethyl bacteriochlorophyllide A dehydrogenase
MKAIRAVGPSQLEVVEVAEPEPGTGALVRVERAGVCGTDVKVFTGKIAGPRPVVMGHEMVGTVVAPGLRRLVAAGTRVIVDPAISCGHCDLCRRGRAQLCRNGGLLGRDADGVFAELVVVPEEKLHVVPEGVSDTAASLLQVLGTCVHAQRQVSVFPTDTAAVLGLGVSGLLHVQLLAARGFKQIAGITRSEWKLELARRFGAAVTTTPARAAEVVEAFTGGLGIDLVVEAVGIEATLGRAIELAGTGGEIIVFGTITSGEAGLPYYQLYHKELTIYNPRAAVASDYDAGIELAAAGRLQLEELVTHTFPPDEAASAFAAVEDPSSLKVVIDFTR